MYEANLKSQSYFRNILARDITIRIILQENDLSRTLRHIELVDS